ncbi:branched-chain amino acid ABC transporter substrate-binding protein [Rhizobacter sp. LjRoot28]|jgi:branched-chain amino acid transport system substrate-binding protein|uniref:branched-chain amino acid ABC transporter substrate-binding protein n=1 Tax=Rhizobacter sp. LjRoot28 TaxID=3342309 RepID=UPI003ECEDBD2
MKLVKNVLAASVASAALLLSAGSAFAQAGETVRIAVIDPQSGPFANLGLNILHTLQFLAERDGGKNPAGVKFEIVPFDNKMSGPESLNVLKAAIDQDIRYVVQGGSGSGVAGALIDAINKHNQRNPGKEVVFLNYAAVDPDLTNSKCSFWHFSYDANTVMKMEAIGTAIKDDKNVKKVYLLNQNYGHGHQVTKYAKEILGRKAPNVQIVGEELHPFGQVKDFAPYIAKIKAAGADTVITGNFGNDLSLVFKAAKDAGLDVAFYTYYAGAAGTPTAIGDTGLGKIKFVYPTFTNLQAPEYQTLFKAFNAKFPNESFATSPAYNIFKSLPLAMAKAKSTDPVKVAKALENLTFKSFTGDVTMRATDHQLQQPLYLATWNKMDAKNNINVEKTGNTWTLEKTFESYISSTPTTCQMKRPA